MNEIYSEYICDFAGCERCLKDPITLPCGETICKEHIDDTSATFKCKKKKTYTDSYILIYIFVMSFLSSELLLKLF